MTTSEEDISRDQSERSGLQKAIADVETALSVSTPGTRRILENSLEGMKGRVATLDKKIGDAIKEREVQSREQSAAAALAAKETKLTADEQATYRGFLEKDYFTKKDFGNLNEFYTHSYDRLSEGGKDEMSKRLHEGIKRGEFKFTELPQAIQSKDNDHCTGKANKEVSAQAHITKSKDSENHPTKLTVKDIDLGSVDLSGVKLVEAPGSPSASNLPDASGSKITQR